MIKELWILIKLLFSSKPSEVRAKGKLEVMVMEHFPFGKFTYMSWCGKIITKSSQKDVVLRFLSLLPGQTVKTHEFGHCVQAETEHGDNWVRYYLSYFWQWIKHNPLIAPASACYYVNRYEVEAYAQEENPAYWVNYTRKNLRGVYSIPNAKKLFKDLGCVSKPSIWKSYVKTIKITN